MEIIKTLRPWRDFKEDLDRKPGDLQVVTDDRLKEIEKGLKAFGSYDWVKPMAYDDVTVGQIKDLLDQRGVKYKADDNKRKLYEALLKA